MSEPDSDYILINDDGYGDDWFPTTKQEYLLITIGGVPVKLIKTTSAISFDDILRAVQVAQAGMLDAPQDEPRWVETTQVPEVPQTEAPKDE